MAYVTIIKEEETTNFIFKLNNNSIDKQLEPSTVCVYNLLEQLIHCKN